MHKTPAETAAFLERFWRKRRRSATSVEIVVAPPFTSLLIASEYLRDTQRQAWRADDALGIAGRIHRRDQRADAAGMRRFVRHSRSLRAARAACDETDRTVNLKGAYRARARIDADRRGRRNGKRSGKRRDRHARRRANPSRLRTASRERGISSRRIADEPIWAIGTGKNCDPAEADRVMGSIRGCISGTRRRYRSSTVAA